MGHKVHPIGIRLGISKDWNSKWFAGKKHFAEYLAADLKVREMLRKKLAAGRHQQDPDRASGQHRARDHPHRPSGRGDRQAWRGHREAAQGSVAT